MPKTAVYQLRLTPEEKAKLAATARGREVSIAGMIREDYELTAEPPRASNPDFGPDSAFAKVIQSLPKEIPPEEPGVLEQVIDAKRITTLARQKYGHFPLGLAERKVREEMGS